MVVVDHPKLAFLVPLSSSKWTAERGDSIAGGQGGGLRPRLPPELFDGNSASARRFGKRSDAEESPQLSPPHCTITAAAGRPPCHRWTGGIRSADNDDN